MKIFKHSQSVSKVDIPGANVPAYVTLQGTAGSALSDILMAKAPATDISITDAVDMSINKALSSDFLIATFGKSPITIRITGMILDARNCSGSGNIPAFFKKYNVHKNKTARVTVCVCVAGASTTYKCVLTSMMLVKNIQRYDCPVASDYVLNLIGVEI